MHTDVETWCLRCHTCQRFRKVAKRQEAPSVIPIEAECWERVMIDIEGLLHQQIWMVVFT